MISLCLTNYNRYDMLIESFANVYNDPRITEIIISDDASDLKIFKRLQEFVKNRRKIKLHRNLSNLGMSRNKRNAIFEASNDWCIIFDSDNILTTEYLDAIPYKTLDPDVIYCPSFARPDFDYRKYQGKLIDSGFISLNGIDNTLNMCLNTCNYLVHRSTYLQIFQHDPKVKASDTIHFNYLWLKSNRSFYVVGGMEYEHRVHKGSGFLQDAGYNMAMAEQTKTLIQQL